MAALGYQLSQSISEPRGHANFSQNIDLDLADTVVLKGSPEIDWQLLATSLQKAGVKHLDFKKMKVYNDEETNTLMFDRCVKALSNVDSLEKLDICRCKSEFVERIAAVCRQLEYITTGSIK
ncbi:hypothetical protein J6590_085038 [Homalodisca vitripennis]|nr:hypothetical protein J6590_085038 [Homalodisca vitripennis]